MERVFQNPETRNERKSQMSSMKQIQFHRFGPPSLVAQCEEAKKPSEPSSWEVIVEVDAFPINPADSAMMMGRYGFLNKPPSTIGMEGAGRIVEMGKSVNDLKIGDPVIILANNNWCQFRKVPATLVVKVPEDANLLQMSMLKVTGLTAWKLLNEVVPMKVGDFVIQNAPLSAVGRYVIQLAQVMGLRTINLVRRSDQLELVKQLGGTINLLDDDEVAPMVRKEIERSPLKLALDCVGGRSTEHLAQCLSESGKIVNYGMLSMEPCTISPEHLIFRNIELTGFWLSRVLNKMSAAERVLQISKLAQLSHEGKLIGPIDSQFSIQQIQEALGRADETGRNGKVIIRPQLDATALQRLPS